MSVAKNHIESTCGKNDFNLEKIKKCVLKDVYPNLFKLLQVAITLPISSATCERSFSAMRRIKTWLRTSMVQNRFNALSVLNIEKQLSKTIDNSEIVDQFSKKNRTIILK